MHDGCLERVDRASWIGNLEPGDRAMDSNAATTGTAQRNATIVRGGEMRRVLAYANMQKPIVVAPDPERPQNRLAGKDAAHSNGLDDVGTCFRRRHPPLSHPEESTRAKLTVDLSERYTAGLEIGQGRDAA